MRNLCILRMIHGFCQGLPLLFVQGFLMANKASEMNKHMDQVRFDNNIHHIFLITQYPPLKNIPLAQFLTFFPQNMVKIIAQNFETFQQFSWILFQFQLTLVYLLNTMLAGQAYGSGSFICFVLIQIYTLFLIMAISVVEFRVRERKIKQILA